MVEQGGGLVYGMFRNKRAVFFYVLFRRVVVRRVFGLCGGIFVGSTTDIGLPFVGARAVIGRWLCIFDCRDFTVLVCYALWLRHSVFGTIHCCLLFDGERVGHFACLVEGREMLVSILPRECAAGWIEVGRGACKEQLSIFFRFGACGLS